jgi:Polysaccharide deacetylase
MSGIFTISLDFELHWGGFEKWPLQPAVEKLEQGKIFFKTSKTDYKNYFLNTRQVIPEMLRLFETYETHVTWATVGLLFHQDKTEVFHTAPAAGLRPSYKQEKLSAYTYMTSAGIGENELDDPFHFAPSLIHRIAETPHQELGTHTYAHYYCNEEGQTVEQFSADLKAAQRIAQKHGVVLKSLVFPRNQFNDAYLKVCFNEGITSVRSNPLDWFWHIDSTQNESPWKRLNRGLDAYFPIGKKNTYAPNTLTARAGYPLCIPASRLLRPYRPGEGVLNRMKIVRIQSEMERAARHQEVYHLWWHPHNFGNFPEESLKSLEQILQHYQRCQSKAGMISLNMGELATLSHAH